MFDKGYYDKDWFENMLDFMNWCDKRMKECQPKGISPQSLYIQSGKAGFDRKFPVFESAYKEYMEEYDQSSSV
jgi:hypothetical protein